MSFFYQKIILPTRPQPDTIVAIFLLKKFGKEKCPRIEKAEIEIWNDLPRDETSQSLDKKGYLLIDIGQGKFDHHQKGKTASQLVAGDLEITDDPALAKLLTYAERDDKYGLGTISADPIDKALGLSGLISSLNKTLPENPQKVIDLVLPIILAHYLEEKKRTEDLPKEFEEKFKKGEAEVLEVKQGKKKLKVVILESSNPSISGWLRAEAGLKADVIVQKIASGHVNILTRPLKKVDLRWLTAFLRNEEVSLRNRKLKLLTFELMRLGRIPEIPEWYYDRATNSILNGGISPKGISPTAIPLEKIKELIKQGLSEAPPQREKTKKIDRSGVHQYFLEIRIPIEKAKEIREMISEAPAGIKLHLPDNYHLTLIHLGDYNQEEIPDFIEKIDLALRKIKPLSITIDNQSFEAGSVPGYPAKAFYFLIEDKAGGNVLNEIRSILEKTIPRFIPQEFFPHLTVATAIPGIEEKVIGEAAIKLKKGRGIKFLVNQIRLVEILRKTNGQVVYKTRHQFLLE